MWYCNQKYRILKLLLPEFTSVRPIHTARTFVKFLLYTNLVWSAEQYVFTLLLSHLQDILHVIGKISLFTSCRVIRYSSNIVFHSARNLFICHPSYMSYTILISQDLLFSNPLIFLPHFTKNSFHTRNSVVKWCNNQPVYFLVYLTKLSHTSNLTASFSHLFKSQKYFSLSLQT